MHTLKFSLPVVLLFVIGDLLAFSPIHNDLSTGIRQFHVDKISENNDSPKYPRLPTNVIPIAYNLEIRPILSAGTPDEFTAPAKVQITLECRQETNLIVLHSSELQIYDENTEVREAAWPNTKILVNDVTYDDAYQTVSFMLGKTLSRGKRYVITMIYEAKIPLPSVRQNGLYRGVYKDADGNERWFASTHFSRTRAFRKLVPSFDEPTHKATFTVSIGRTAPYHTLFNTELDRTEPIEGIPGWHWDHYKTTPIMPPTIIAMVISDFTFATGIGFSKPVKIWGPPNLIANGDANFAAASVAKTLAQLDTYYSPEVPYELSKMDSVGVDHFQPGAMENWGLNIYRSPLMYWNEKTGTGASKFSIANVIAHELAHQWWGNVVTHAWWNDWWLTEGFASYYEYIFFDKVYKDEFKPMNRLITDDIHAAMAFDITPDSVPIHGSVTDDFVENPSVINYNKGSAIVHMMDTFMGKDQFKKATISYLKNQAYRAVDQDVLFAELQASLKEQNELPTNGKTVKEIMDTWTLQTGFPLIRISKSSSDPELVYFTQESFLQNRQGNPQEKSWHVPISFISEADATLKPKLWIGTGEVLRSLKLDTKKWILVNPNVQGYFRVLYDDHFGSLLKSLLASNLENVPEPNRAQLVDDYFSLAHENYIKYDDVISMTEFMSQEREFTPWITFLKHLRRIYNIAAGSDPTTQEDLKAYILPKLGNALEQIGVIPKVEEPMHVRIIRTQLLDWACSMDYTECIQYARDTLTEWRAAHAEDPKTANPIQVDIRPVIYCAAVAQDSDHFENLEFFKSMYRETKDIAFHNAIRCSSSKEVLSGLLEEAQNEKLVPKNEAWGWIAEVGRNPLFGRHLVIDLLEKSLPDLVDYIGTVVGVESILSGMAIYTSSSDEIERIEGILLQNDDIVKPIRSQLDISTNLMKSNRDWTQGKRLLNAISASLKNMPLPLDGHI